MQKINNHRPKGRIMLREAGEQFTNFHFGRWWRPNAEMLAEDFEEGVHHVHSEMELLKRKQQSPKLSDEYMDDY